MQKAEYKTLVNKICECKGCQKPAFAQFYICSLDKHVAVCKTHDIYINYDVLKIVFTYKDEIEKWMIPYEKKVVASPIRTYESSKKPSPKKRKGKTK